MSVEDEVVGQEDSDEELFYESLDRILSSSATSTSASDDDDADLPRRRRGYDVDLWTSEPAPIQERRHRLLHLMGLAGDPSLARFEVGRRSAASPVTRSKSDGPSTPIGYEDPSCLIRNLDDGSQFVVAPSESGLREVGTGRQLTVEEFHPELQFPERRLERFVAFRRGTNVILSLFTWSEKSPSDL